MRRSSHPPASPGAHIARRSLLAALAALALSCGDPTGAGDAPSLAIGQAVTGHVADTTDQRDFILNVPSGTRFVIYFQAPDERLRLLVLDRRTQDTVAAAEDAQNRTDPRRHYVGPIVAGGGGYRLRVSAPRGSRGGGDFRLEALRIDAGSETVPAELTIGDTIVERIGHPADVDEFTFSLAAGQRVNVFLQSLEAGPGAPSATVTPATGDGLYSEWPVVRGAGAGKELDEGASGVIPFVAPGRYRVTVRTADVEGSTSTFTGAYRLQVYPIDSRPEHAPATLAAGDTLESESIDRVGDADEFTLVGTPGAEYNLFAQARGAAPHGVTATVLLPGDAPAATALADGTALLRTPSGRFVMPASGGVVVRVAGINDRGGLHRGPYRLFAHRLDRAPEGRSAVLALGSGPVSGAIDVIGDVDEYRVSVPAATTVNLIVARPAGTVGGVVGAVLLPAAGGVGAASAGTSPWYDAPGTAAAGSSGNFILAAGEYVLRVSGTSSGPDGFQGAYEVLLHPVNAAPERVPATVAIGDTVTGEAVDPEGDADTFVIDAVPADTFYTVLLPPAGAATLPDFEFGVRAPGSAANVGLGRVDVAQAGRYEVRVASLNEGRKIGERGPYRLAVVRGSGRPERAGALLAFDDTVRTESLDFSGDFDDFALVAPPGREVTLTFTWGHGLNPGGVELHVTDPATGTRLRGVMSFGEDRSTGRVTVPAGGALRVRVAGTSTSECQRLACAPTTSPVGAYSVVAHLVDPAPEGRSAAFAVGDTVAGVAIDPAGDIDEYTFAGAAGQRLDVYFQTPNGICCSVGLTLQLIDPATGAVLGTVSSYNATARLEDVGMRGVTLPATHVYLVRVLGVIAEQGTGPYRFRVAPAP